MFKLVVLSVLLALASAKPSYLQSLVAPAVYAAPSVYAVPTAVSHQSRTDVHSSPALVSSYLTSPVVSAYSTPVVSSYSAPQYVSSYSAPLVSAYHGQTLLAAAPSTLALAPNTPAVVTKATGVPLETIEVINAREAHYTAKALNAHGIHKRSIATPLAYSVVYAPTAVSHQSRVDVHSSNVLAYSAPVVSAYSTPVVSAYSTPVVSSYAAPQYVSSYSAPLVSAYHGQTLLAAAPSTLALAPNTPAVVTKSTGVPLETIEVINAREAHYTAKALNAHGIHKRSIATPLAYSAVYAPTAVSHQSRVDVHSSPAIAYSTPVVSAYSTPVVSAYSTPVVSAYSTPVVSSYAAPQYVSSYSAPLVSAYHGQTLLAAAPSTLALAPNTPAVVTKATGVPLETIEVINAREAHYTAKALKAHGIHKRSIATPLAYSAVYAPTAVSHQSRVDVHSSPAIAYSTPVVSAYTSPLIKTYSTPALSAYSTPLLKSYSPLVSAYSSPLVSAYSSPVISHSGPAYSVHPW